MGRVHSFQSLGTLDGPGVRFTVFMQGCCLRCACCHNPDTWDMSGGKEYTPKEIVDRAVRFKEYFGNEGGITVTGGEPLLQADFVREVFALCHIEGIGTCLDTSGCILDERVKALLKETDRVLLDVKYTENEFYERYVGCSLDSVTAFLGYLEKESIPTTLRQVIIPTVNDTEENIKALREIAVRHKCVDMTELLPFKKICQTKYDSMGVAFPFGDKPTPTRELMTKLESLLK